MTSPSTPAWSASTHTFIARVECPKLPTCVTTPIFFAMRPMIWASGTVYAIGFSTNTWMPRFMAMIAAGAWWRLEVQITTASIESPISSKSGW